ncbi:mannonate dehydratase [Secundilactobacillus folii]|uniref:Mannonate dehydratase n=1 Tax=Secundilactobacillus folii TaxID=2678357 RepID=A0A7X2XYC0_9LACO|nr:mannonate dehydratase [Secundilactobacillus folii]MTV83305.1 mannonate dehydratase [Secundilactobacillus folii]
MKMSFRWFGPNDPITLADIRQVPKTRQIVGMLTDIPVGDVWPLTEIKQLRDQINAYGFELKVIESVNIHDAIKTGAPTRDRYIENYIQTIRNLAKVGVTVICYNFMPIFDWIRTDLNYPLTDGSQSMRFDLSKLPRDPQVLFNRIKASDNNLMLPGWEPERLAQLKQLFKSYENVSESDLVANLKYFLKAIIPVCEEVGIQMAIHPDDPPMSLFGLPRIYKNLSDMKRIAALVDSPYNGFTICTGSLGENTANDVPAIIREFVPTGRVPFVHLRNIKHIAPNVFQESAHESSEGSLDMYAIMQALHDSDFNGYARSDHGRNIWGENGRPGYGLYDRAMGISYLNGLWEAIQKKANN